MTLNAKAKALAYLEAKTITLNVRAKAEFIPSANALEVPMMETGWAPIADAYL
jgi:hypothetical protein